MRASAHRCSLTFCLSLKCYTTFEFFYMGFNITEINESHLDLQEKVGSVLWNPQTYDLPSPNHFGISYLPLCYQLGGEGLLMISYIRNGGLVYNLMKNISSTIR